MAPPHMANQHRLRETRDARVSNEHMEEAAGLGRDYQGQTPSGPSRGAGAQEESRRRRAARHPHNHGILQLNFRGHIYVVRKGWRIGYFQDYEEARMAHERFPGAQHRRCSSLEEAREYMMEPVREQYLQQTRQQEERTRQQEERSDHASTLGEEYDYDSEDSEGSTGSVSSVKSGGTGSLNSFDAALAAEHHHCLKYLLADGHLGPNFQRRIETRYMEWIGGQRIDPTGDNQEGVLDLGFPDFMRISRMTGPGMTSMEKKDIDPTTNTMKGKECVETWENQAIANQWTSHTLLLGMKNGQGLYGDARKIWEETKESGNEILNAKMPKVNDIEEVLLMYLKVRYTFYMILGRPVAMHDVRAMLAACKIEGKRAKERKKEVLHIISVWVKKRGHTPEGLLNELEAISSRTTIGNEWYIAFAQKLARQRETCMMTGVGNSKPVTYEDIRWQIGLLGEDEILKQNLQDNKAKENALALVKPQPMKQNNSRYISSTAANFDDEQDWREASRRAEQDYRAADRHMNVENNIRHQQEEVNRQYDMLDQARINTAYASPSTGGQGMDKYKPPADRWQSKDKSAWLKCDGCDMIHPGPTGISTCCQRELGEDGQPKMNSRWAKWNGWNLEYMASLPQFVIPKTMNRMKEIGNKGIPSNLVDHAMEEVRKLREKAGPGKYRVRG
jgi:hypothetical protein